MVRLIDCTTYVVKHPLFSTSTHVKRLAVPRIDQPINVTSQYLHYLLRETIYTHVFSPPAACLLHLLIITGFR